MSYTSVFGGNTIFPADPSLYALTLSGTDVTLEWPTESAAPEHPAARIIAVTAENDDVVTLPDATLASVGQMILFDNLSDSSDSFTVENADGDEVATVGVGEQWLVYLYDNSDEAGTWQATQMGAASASALASSLNSYGLKVISNRLAQSMPVTTFSSTPTTLAVTDRASVLVWTANGAGTLNLMAAATAATNFFCSVRNSGGGNLTIDPSGAETIDGAATLTLVPGDSVTIVTNGTAWYTVGRGQQAIFAFDFTAISLASAGTSYALSGSELNRIAYQFTGVLSNNVNVIVPSTTQQYWVTNDTTGPYALTISTSGGVPITVDRGASTILYCNGTNVLKAELSDIPFDELPDGSVGAPSLAFVNDTDTGIYLGGSNTLTLTAGGVAVASAGSAGLILGSSKQVRLDAGTVGAPGLAFAADTNTGLYQPNDNEIAVALGGVALLTFANAFSTLANFLAVPNGDAANPSVTFTNDTDTGIYRIGANSLGITAGGSLKMTVASAGITFNAAASTATTFTSTGDVNFSGAATLRIPTGTPASAAAAGSAGQMLYDSSYLYICLSTGVWRRVAHATW